MAYDYDLIVIGAGSGGVRAARIAAKLGAKVAIVEERHLGGTCVNVGCVPKKLLVYASQYSSDFLDAAGYGWSIDSPHFDWSKLAKNKSNEVARLNGIYGKLLDSHGVELIWGSGAVTSPHDVAVNGESFSAERILLAVGGEPWIPSFEGSQHVLTSNDMFSLDTLSKRWLVVGGGYIAVEFAGILHGLGCEVEQLYRGEMFLRGFDNEIRHFLSEQITERGIRLGFNLNVERIERKEEGLIAYLTDGSQREVDAVLYATGRKAKLAGLFDGVSPELSKGGAVKVNDQYQTSIPSIYAIGDMIGKVELTPVAIAEGMALAEGWYANKPLKVDYENIPTAVFSQPNVATVGLTEEQALEQYTAIKVFRSSFRPMKFTLAGRTEKMLMKLIVDQASDRVVGAHMVGDDAGEIIQGVAVAIKAGATKAMFDQTIGIHPTAAEEFVTMS
ncbi:MAG: glutathione-disulfide reductase [Kangiellaceae bacterium]|nr:glutathione-disulfide reductase [Kangiellaceae bacterium]|tara:strand:- start:1453 stop:2787 length:1335 start_codon:yes stop_codon:yes gene_type:complete